MTSTRIDDYCATFLPSNNYACLHADGLLGMMQYAREHHDPTRLRNINTIADLHGHVNVHWCKVRWEFSVDMAYTPKLDGPLFDLPGTRLDYARLSGFSNRAVYEAKCFLESEPVVKQLQAWLAEVVALREELEAGA